MIVSSSMSVAENRPSIYQTPQAQHYIIDVGRSSGTANYS